MENGRLGLDNQQSKISNQKSIILKNIGCLVTANADGVQYIKDTSILIENGKIIAISEGESENSIDCGGKMVTCGFVDSHTHPVFLDNRDEEYAMSLAGATIEAKSGYGLDTESELKS